MEIHKEEAGAVRDTVVLIGTQTGLLKQVNVHTGEGRIVYGTPAREADVLTLEGRGEMVLMAKKNRVVLLFRNETLQLTVTGFGDDLAGAHWWGLETIVCVTVSGAVHVVDLTGEAGKIPVYAVKPDQPWLTVNAPVEATAMGPKEMPHVLAVGGKENRLRLWDLREKSKLFEARNPPDDWLQLKVPMWISGLAVVGLREEEGVLLVAVVTRHHDVLLYKTSEASRRPVWQTKVGEDPLLCVKWGPGHKEMYCASATGYVFQLNAASGKILGRMTPSSSGAIRDLHVGRHVVAVGLDRFVYAYDPATRKVVHKVYAKQRMSRVVLLSEHVPDEDLDDLVWLGLPGGKSMPDNQDKEVSRKRESLSTSVVVDDAPPANAHTGFQRALKKIKARAGK